MFTSREERIRVVIEGRESDHIPTSVWIHIPDENQDPCSLIETMMEFNETYDYGFIKMMSFGAYTVSGWGTKLDIYYNKYKEVEIAAPGTEYREDYRRIQPLSAVYGTWGKML